MRVLLACAASLALAGCSGEIKSGHCAERDVELQAEMFNQCVESVSQNERLIASAVPRAVHECKSSARDLSCVRWEYPEQETPSRQPE